MALEQEYDALVEKILKIKDGRWMTGRSLKFYLFGVEGLSRLEEAEEAKAEHQMEESLRRGIG